MDVEEIKQDILERYAMSWDNAEDNMGLIKIAKDNFEYLVSKLIEAVENR